MQPETENGLGLSETQDVIIRTITRRFVRTDWMNHRACTGQDPEIFYIEGKYVLGSAAYRRARNKALAFCNECTVKAECLNYGMDEQVGIFGGMTSAQRRRARGIVTIVNGELE